VAGVLRQHNPAVGFGLTLGKSIGSCNDGSTSRVMLTQNTSHPSFCGGWKAPLQHWQ